MSAEARPLRLLLVADVAPNPDSGAAGTDLAIASELERQGHEVVAVWEDRIRHRIRHWNLHHLLEQPRVARRARQQKPAVALRPSLARIRAAHQRYA
jgi:hypothetical protein